MASSNIRIAQAITVGLFLSFGMTSASARAAGTAHDRWSAAHIDQLPPDIRGDINRTCGASKRAEHEFATFMESGRLITLHFEHLRCGAPVTACSQKGCLRQVYVAAGGRYRLVRSYHGGRD
jgi:hypothetical protein